MTLKHKLMLPIGFFLVILAVVGIFYFQSGSIAEEFGVAQARLSALSTAVRDTNVQTKAFVENNRTLAELQSDFQRLREAATGSGVVVNIDHVWAVIESIQKLKQRNAVIGQDIAGLTALSIKQSNDYIHAVSERLQDRVKRDMVTDLERAVIRGANTNTTSSYEVRVRFGALEEDLGTKESLLEYLETLAENVAEDARRLRGTPYEQLVENARDANTQITGLVTEFIANRESEESMSRQLLSEMEDTMAILDRDALARSESTLTRITSFFQWLFGIVLGITLIALAISGRLTRRIYEILSSLIQDISTGSTQVGSASQQVASSSQSLAQGASEQAASLEETSSSSEEIASMTRRNAENAQAMAQLMAEAAKIVGNADRKLEEMENSIMGISDAGDKIVHIIKVIDGIAFQTNILALNAAVGAARAGESGMGFAVVADEVRGLAQRSAQAARDTAELIEESLAKSGEGRENLQRLKEGFAANTEVAGKVKELVDEVNGASQEQALGIERVSQAVRQLNHVTQQTAAHAEESAAAAEELSAQAEKMQLAARELEILLH